MPYITEIRKQGDLAAALTSFSATCAANAVALGGLTAPQLAEIAAMATGFTNAINAHETAKAALSLAMENKEQQFAACRATLSKWAKTFRANPTITDGLLDQLNLPHHKTPGTKTAPTQPQNLTAKADGLGLVALKWNRNGNRSGTQYFVETQTEPGGEWTISGGTTKTKFSFQATVGEYIAFRIVASRDNLLSQASVPVQLWVNGGGQTLSLAA